jgi:hypothetical protein
MADVIAGRTTIYGNTSGGTCVELYIPEAERPVQTAVAEYVAGKIDGD